MTGKTMDNKKTILVLESLTTVSGGQMVLLNLLSVLKKDFNFKVAVPGKGKLADSLKSLDVKIINFKLGTYSLGAKGIKDVVKYVFFWFFSFGKLFFNLFKVDLIYINSSRILPLGIVLGVCWHKSIVWHNHSLLSDSKTISLISFLAKYSGLKKIIAVSKIIVDQFPQFKNKTEIVGNGIDLDKFKYFARGVDNKKNIVVVGDLIPTKGQDFLLKALSSLKDFDWVLNIVGSTRANYFDYENNLKKSVLDLGLNERVNFLGRRDDVNKILSESDLLVMPSSVSESFGLVILEAMASGVPVIAANSGGPAEIVKHNETGYLFEINNLDSLILYLHKFFNLDSDKISEMKKNCRREAESKYNLENNANKIKQIINDVLN